MPPAGFEQSLIHIAWDAKKANMPSSGWTILRCSRLPRTESATRNPTVTDPYGVYGSRRRRIHTTFSHDRTTDTWSWTIDNVDKTVGVLVREGDATRKQ
jgi:hypothetical protein